VSVRGSAGLAADKGDRMMCRRTPDEAIIKQIAVFISSHFKMPLRARGDDEGRPPGQLRVLIRQLGYSDYEITRWLWHGEEPGPGLPPMTLAWAALIEGHLALGSCNCAEEERQRHPHRRADYIQKKRERCRERHALAQQPGSGLDVDKEGQSHVWIA
ncbi:MAG: hypothetical protein ACE5K7_06645, partial [Phycisphaerae bacterium]